MLTSNVYGVTMSFVIQHDGFVIVFGGNWGQHEKKNNHHHKTCEPILSCFHVITGYIGTKCDIGIHVFHLFKSLRFILF